MLASGEVVRLGSHELADVDGDNVLGPLLSGVHNILSRHDEAISNHKPQSLVNSFY